MKLNLFKTYLLLFYFSLFILAMGCKKDENIDKIVTMTVAANTVKGTPILSNTETDYLYVKEEGSKEGWTAMYMSEIEGFDYVEGYEYILKVRKYSIKNPLQDGSSIGYTLIEVLSKTKVDNPQQ